MIIGIVAVVIVVIGGTFVVIGVNSGGGKKPAATAGAPGPEVIPLETGTPLADLSKAATGTTLNGIQCQSSEQVAYHVHAHLAVYVNGALRPIPLGIGIVKPNVTNSSAGPFAAATQCYYWLHTHTTDGVIHIESPTNKLYPLSDFFAIWGQPLSKTQVGPATGTVTAYVDGKLFTGDPQTISLSAHEDIQLDVGTVVAPVSVDWTPSGL